MEMRRVQITGGSSYSIILPKDWAKSVNLKKNDQLALIRQSDGNLLISPKMIEKQIKSEKKFFININTDQKYLLRQLIGAYIIGYNLINLISKERMPSLVRSSVRTFIQITIGQEIFEETDTNIVIKNLLDPTEMPFDKTNKRMYIIVKGMHEDIMIAIQKNDIKLVKDVLNRDNEVDRLHWLVARQYNIILQNVSFTEKMKVTLELATTSYLISRIIERIGDHVIRIAKNLINIMDRKLEKTLIENLNSANKLALDIFNKSINSLLRRDIKLANATIESLDKLEIKCKQINKIALNFEGEFVISLGYIVESIRRIGEYSSDISENVINYLIREEKI